MTKAAPKTTITTVRDSKSGRFVTVKGAGALKGKMSISKKVDLTKPLFPDASGKWSSKHSKTGNNANMKGNGTACGPAKH